MFRGINTINLDDKGRLAIPTRYRAAWSAPATLPSALPNSLRTGDPVGGDPFNASASATSLIITIDTEERCLLLYPLTEWMLIEQKLQALPSFNREARRIQRLLIGHATDLELDSHHRILLPAPLRDYAHLQKAVVLVGQGKKCEIWDEAHWQSTRDQWIQAGLNHNSALPPELETLSL